MPGVDRKRMKMHQCRQVDLQQLSKTIEPQVNHHQTQQDKNIKMGNVADRSDSCEESIDQPTILPQKEEEKENECPEQEPEQNQSTNLMFHLYSYRQQLNCKKHHVMKMVTSKLLLTEELLKLQPIKHSINTKSMSAWDDDFELSLLSDEELDDDDDELEFNDDPLAAELTSLKNYRKELRNIILDVATEKLKKCTKKKLKRLKRRTLISSKKPSKKKKSNTHYEDCEQNQQQMQHEEDQEESTEVIVID